MRKDEDVQENWYMDNSRIIFLIFSFGMSFLFLNIFETLWNLYIMARSGVQICKYPPPLWTKFIGIKY